MKWRCAMKKKQTTTLEMRYYNIPKDEYVLALYGESWTIMVP